jgi:putative transcriptional regulator
MHYGAAARLRPNEGEMSKIGDELIASMKEAVAHARGEKTKDRVHRVEIDVPDVKAIRKKLSLNQEAFAERFHLPLGSVRNWEQKRRRPEGPALVLLKVIDRNPRAVMAALEDEKPKRRTA